LCLLTNHIIPFNPNSSHLLYPQAIHFLWNLGNKKRPVFQQAFQIHLRNSAAARPHHIVFGFYFFGPAGGLFPLPPPDKFPVVLGPFAGLPPFDMVVSIKMTAYSVCFSASASCVFWTSE
jgi:hypothetical protein